MIESPVLQRLVDEASRSRQVKLILHQLAGKFGSIPESVSAGLALMKDEEQIFRLGVSAVKCSTMQAFEDDLRKELPAPAPSSTRGKRRQKPSA